MKCYPLNEAGEDSVLGFVFTAIACLMRSFAMRDKTETRFNDRVRCARLMQKRCGAVQERMKVTPYSEAPR